MQKEIYSSTTLKENETIEDVLKGVHPDNCSAWTERLTITVTDEKKVSISVGNRFKRIAEIETKIPDFDIVLNKLGYKRK